MFLLSLPVVPLISLYQDMFQSVMWVEIAIDADFAVPAVTKELGDKVKGAKAWLQGLTMVLAPQSLDRDMQPIVPEPGPIALGGSLLIFEDILKGGV
jgi:hypothetical protein